MRTIRLAIAIPALIFVAPLLRADTIIDGGNISTIIETGASSSGPSVDAAQYLEQGWTQTQSYDELSIFVLLSSWTPDVPFDVTAYLTTGLGASASAAIATASFTGVTSGSTAENLELFTGLTLGPGTYYLTLSSTDSAGAQPGAIWETECFSGCATVLAPGIALLDEGFANSVFGAQDASYAPASIFDQLNSVLNLEVTADPPPPNSSAPEPSTAAASLLLLAGLLLAARR